MIIAKSVIVDALRDRGLTARADWVNRELPDQVDPAKHTGLLSTLNLDLEKLVAADQAS